MVTPIAGRLPPPPPPLPPFDALLRPPRRYPTRILPPPPPPPPPPPSCDALHLQPPTERPIQFFPPRTGATVSPIFALLRPPPRYPTQILPPPPPPPPPPPSYDALHLQPPTERPIQFLPPRTDATVTPNFALFLPPGYPPPFPAPRTDATVTPIAVRFPPPPPPPPPIAALRPPTGCPIQFLRPPTDATTDTMLTPLGARLPPPPPPFFVRFPPLPPMDAMADTVVTPSQTEMLTFTGMLTFLQHQYDSIRREHDVVHNKAAVLDAELNMKMPKPRSSGNSDADETVTEELTNLCHQLTQLRDELREIFKLIDEIKTLQYKQKREDAEKPAKDELMVDNKWEREALEGYHAFRKRFTEGERSKEYVLMPGNKRKKALPIKNDGESSSSQSLQPRLRRSARLGNDGESSSSQSLQPRLRRSARLQQSARL